MQTIGFITSSEDPDLISDDLLAVRILEERGYVVQIIIWDQVAPSELRVDLLVFRSCWNYHRKQREFIAWVKQLESLSVPLWNSAKIVQWNLHKRYLLELSALGVRTPRSCLLSTAHCGQTWRDSLHALRAPQLVLKPAVSLNGHDTYLVNADDERLQDDILRALTARGEVIAQEFIPEVQTQGEVSLVFLQGQFSHAICKTPRAGEFRVHVEYGGQRQPYEPSEDILRQAREIVSKIDEPLLFARVDAVEREGVLILIELELIDPMLFLGYHASAAARFAACVEALLPR